MDVSSEIELMNKLRENQKSGIKALVIIGSSAIVIGLFTIIAAHLVIGDYISGNLKTIMTLGGSCFSTLASYSAKEFFPRRDKIAATEFLLEKYRKFQKTDKPDVKEFEFYQSKFELLIAKSLGS